MNKEIKFIMLRYKIHHVEKICLTKPRPLWVLQLTEKQHNYIARLNKESKHDYFDSLDTKRFKPLWNVYKPYFF